MEFHAQKSIFIFLLLLCQEVLLIQGRQIKSESRQSNPTRNLRSEGSGDSGAVEGDDDFRPTTPGDSPGVSHSADEEDGDEVVGIKHPVMGLPGSPPGEGHSVADRDQKHAGIDDFQFRPTSQGDSPGVGHYSHLQDEQQNEQKSVSHSLSDTDGFKPTNPGHSPGVGHSDRN